MKKLILGCLLAGLAGVATAVEPYGVLPTEAHMAYQEREILGLVCWGPNAFTDQEWGFGNVPASRVAPDALDPEQWVVAMKAGEIKSVVLVAKHHDGFCLWPSKLCPDNYSTATAAATAKGRDIVGELAAACRKHGLKFGVYISPWDRHQTNYATPAYVDYFFGQWREVLTNYGEICEVWLDGANGGTGWYGGVNGDKGERRSIPKNYYRLQDLLNMMHELQPTAIAFGGGGAWSSTWCGNEAGHSPVTWKYVRKGHDGKEHWVPSECDTPFRGGWYFHARERPKSLARLVKTYYESVGRAAVLDFGISPDNHGLICADDVKRLKEFGDWVRAFNAVDYAAGAKRTTTNAGTVSNDKLALPNVQTVTLKLPKPVTFNTFDLQEDIRLGQRITAFVFEAKIDGKWVRKFEGTTVGYRRFANVGPITTDEVRVVLTGEAEPVLKTFALRMGQEIRSEEEVKEGTLSRTKWRPFWASCGTLGAVNNVIDGEKRTLWHTHLKLGPEGRVPPPQGFAIDCGEPVKINGFIYWPRQDRCKVGVIDAYQFYTSDDGKNWTLRSQGEFGNISANCIRQRVSLPSPVTARYVKFIGTHAIEGNTCCSAADFSLF